LIGLAAACPSGAHAQSDQKLTIDIPVQLEKANVVFDIGKLVLNGDMPFFIGDMDLLATDLKDWNVKGQVIAVFHGDAAYLVLNDDAYDGNRHIQTGHPVKTGNPYAKLMAALMEQGVQIELCGRPRRRITGATPTSFPE
jgi:intracellular sulfur oxidation DsrE/DsrF family protein